MANHVFAVTSGDDAPIGPGSAESWFHFYKFRPDLDEELYVRLPPGTSAAEGDTLTFLLDGDVIGVVPVQRVEADFLTDEVEAWYLGTNIICIQPGVQSTDPIDAVAEESFPTSPDVLRAGLEKAGLPLLTVDNTK